MKPSRVLVLVHETLVPPADSAGYSEQQIDEWRTEYDVTTSLRAMGHDVKVLGMGDNLAELRSTVTDWQPDLAFNLLEEFQGIVTYDQYVVAFLELMRLPYTGCNPRGMMISRDKALSKQVLAYHRIPTARFAVLPRDRRYREPRRLKFPLFVKSATEDASLGISQASIVHDGHKLRERVEFIHEQTSSDALVEEYIEGREIYIGVIGNDRLTTFPLWELNFGTLPDVMAGIATRKVKWDRKYQLKHGIGTGPALDLPDGLALRIGQLARRIYRALCLSGYARIDLRLKPDGSVFVLEANANPNLALTEDLATSALSSGVGYDALLERIMRFGISYQAAWRQA
ncbi:MAG: D-alanine--D-alanine ligase [Pseudomonadota bacterium]|jgi:D-alanine-D-alanine ligase|nr:D-alanine--D-alanine ligase [Pseudomonadota bacterium]